MHKRLPFLPFFAAVSCIAFALSLKVSALPKIDPVLLSKSEPDEKHDFLARAKWSPSAIQGLLFPHGCKCLCSEQPAAVKGAP